MCALLQAASQGDREAEQTLLEQNCRLIRAVVRRYLSSGVDPDDLYQLGCLGFLKAVHGFDPALGCAFSTYAVPKIAGEIRRFLRDDGVLKVSRTLKERASKVARAQAALEAAHGRCPTVHELADATGLTVEEVAMCEQATLPVDSLERPLPSGNMLGDLLGEDGHEERICLSISLRQALDALPDRERRVLLLRFVRDLTQQQVARLMGVSQVQISRLERRAIAALREQLTKE